MSNLDVPPATPGFLKEGFKSVVEAAVAPKFDMDLEMVYEADGKPGRLMAIEEEEVREAVKSGRGVSSNTRPLRGSATPRF